MGNRLLDKIAIVTGASQGIGEATARRFADEGATVVLCARREDKLKEIIEEIRAAGGQAEAAALDVSDENAVNAAVAGVVKRHGRVDVLVNNAAQLAPGTAEETTTEAWHQNFTVSLDGTLFCMRAVLGPMRKAGSGSIVNISSVSGILASPGMVGYSSAKAAIIQLSKNVALENGPHNIRCNALCPGAFMTPATEAFLPTEEVRAAIAKSIPIGRIGDPAECANAILFLASDDASYVTGACLVADGGKTTEMGGVGSPGEG